MRCVALFDFRRTLNGRMDVLALFAVVLLGVLVLWRAGGLETAVGTDTAGMAVDRVIDGDTLVIGGKRLRLWGIDAPELDAAGGAESAATLGALVAKGAACRTLYQDEYERDVVQCDSAGADIGGLMVKLGRARDARTFSHGFYAEEEAFARGAGLGLWAE